MKLPLQAVILFLSYGSEVLGVVKRAAARMEREEKHVPWRGVAVRMQPLADPFTHPPRANLVPLTVLILYHILY